MPSTPLRIKEVCERFSITADTLRYYEKIGAIPPVPRSAGGIRQYFETELDWIKNAICMRDAGVPVDVLAHYVQLAQGGEAAQTVDVKLDSFRKRRALLVQAKEEIEQHITQAQREVERLCYKISRYDKALETGELTWD